MVRQDHCYMETCRGCYTVPEVKVQYIPYTTCKMVPEERCEVIKCRRCKYVPEEHVCCVPYMTCRMVSQECVRQVPCTTCTLEPYCVTCKVCRRIPVCEPVCEPACPPPCSPGPWSMGPRMHEWLAHFMNRRPGCENCGSSAPSCCGP